jgi:hypothetical protein
MKLSFPDVKSATMPFDEPLQSQPGTHAQDIVSEQLRTRDPNWLLIDEGFTLTREHEVESLFAISQWYGGNRGSQAEGSPLSAPATIVAG